VGKTLENKNKKAILGLENPFGATFDKSISYAPSIGQIY
jgi:hypothetical protein